MIELLFIRHGATAGNLQKRYIGRSDEPLSAAGRAALAALPKEALQAERLFSSPMLRARQTAALLFPELPCTLIDDLRETDFGIFEGKSAEELADCPEYQAWLDSLCRGPIPGGEDPAAFKARCRAAFAEAIAGLSAGTRAAFVVHGGVIMAILEAYARPARDFYRYHIENGSCLLCRYAEGSIDGKSIRKLP